MLHAPVQYDYLASLAYLTTERALGVPLPYTALAVIGL